VNRLHRLLALAAVLALVATACGTVQGSPSSRPATVRLALDWTPNSNHLGFYVARNRGFYDAAAVELKVLPYTGTTPEALLVAHQAECGISFQDSMTFAVAAGAKIKSVMAILQHTAQEIAVLADSGITRPRELDGKIYAGFGYPNEEPTVRAVIEADGGKGEFKSVLLGDAAAYQALYARRADFAIVFTAWEGIDAQQQGIAMRQFAFTDYGFPDFYQVVLACDADWLAREPDAARRFVTATRRGFEEASRDAAGAAAILVEENPGVFDANPKLPLASADFLAKGGFWTDEEGNVGGQTVEKWAGYSGFLYDQGLLVDAAGKPLTAPPDYAALFTDDFLK
jgi:ABC-type nitrate/sulfonate/bicarbonate transport system substrate-binding protein